MVIVTKLFYTVLDVWDFCNSIIYGCDVPNSIQIHLPLNKRNREELNEGKYGLMSLDLHLLRNYFLLSLRKTKITEKIALINSKEIAGNKANLLQNTAHCLPRCNTLDS